jgi:hypothetical protein
VESTDEATRLHHLVLIHGRERARELVTAKLRPLVDIAAEVMADESQRIGISYTGFCLTSLPHKRLLDDQTWEKKGHRVTLWVEPGRMKVRGKLSGSERPLSVQFWTNRVVTPPRAPMSWIAIHAECQPYP